MPEFLFYLAGLLLAVAVAFAAGVYYVLWEQEKESREMAALKAAIEVAPEKCWCGRDKHPEFDDARDSDELDVALTMADWAGEPE